MLAAFSWMWAILKLGPFFWFGGSPGERLPDIRVFKVGKHTNGDATGRKAERPNIRVASRSRFERVESIERVVERLFGVKCKTVGAREGLR